MKVKRLFVTAEYDMNFMVVTNDGNLVHRKYLGPDLTEAEFEKTANDYLDSEEFQQHMEAYKTVSQPADESTDESEWNFTVSHRRNEVYVVRKDESTLFNIHGSEEGVDFTEMSSQEVREYITSHYQEVLNDLL